MIEGSGDAGGGMRKQRRGMRVAAVVAGWLALTVLLGVLYVRMPPNPDQEIFDYLSWVVHSGGRLYVDATEQNFPGKIWIHEVSTGLFGNHIWSFRLFDYLFMLAACPVLFAALQPEVGRRRALVVVPFYQALYVTAGWWMSGQRDIVAAPMLLAAGLCYRARARGRSRFYLALFALGVVYAALVRPTYLLYAPLVVAADLLTARRRQRTVTQVAADALGGAASCVVGVVVLALVARHAGSFAAFYESAIRYNTEVYGRSESYAVETAHLLSLFRSWHWYTLFAIAGGWVWFKRGHDRFLLALVALVIVTAIASAFLQLKGFTYHFAGILTALAVLDVYFILWCYDRIRSKSDRTRIAVAAMVSAVAVLGLASKVRGTLGAEVQWLAGRRTERELLTTYSSGTTHTSYADLLDAVEYLRRSVPPDGRVLVWGTDVHLNFLSERRSPSRFITVTMLVGARAPFPPADAWTHELEDVFARQPPAVIFLPAADLPLGVALWTDPNPSGAVQVLRRQVLTRYKPEALFGSLSLYRLQQPPAVLDGPTRLPYANQRLE
jgi:hypothetical protein